MINTDRLRELMNGKDMSQRDLGNELGVTEQMVHYILQGKRIPSLAVYSDMCRVLGVSMDELVKEG